MRSVPEWIGKNDDQQPPPRVRLRVFELHNGQCHRCTRKIQPGERWTLEHLIAIINGGQNRESNLCLTCDWCLPLKNAQDVSEKSKVYRVKKRHRGLRSKSRFGCARSGKWKKKLDGTVVPR